FCLEDLGLHGRHAKAPAREDDGADADECDKPAKEATACARPGGGAPYPIDTQRRKIIGELIVHPHRGSPVGGEYTRCPGQGPRRKRPGLTQGHSQSTLPRGTIQRHCCFVIEAMYSKSAS